MLIRLAQCMMGQNVHCCTHYARILNMIHRNLCFELSPPPFACALHIYVFILHLSRTDVQLI